MDNKEKVTYQTDTTSRDDLDQEDFVNNKVVEEERLRLREEEKRANEVPMSNGENCGIVEFEGKRINTCKGEKSVEDGYKNPDKNDN